MTVPAWAPAVGARVEFGPASHPVRGEVRQLVTTRERVPRDRALIRVADAGYETFRDLGELRPIELDPQLALWP